MDEETRIGPVTMREDDSRNLARDIFRPIEITRHEKAGDAFEINFLDGIFPLVDATVDDGVEGRLGWHWPEALRNEELAADEITAGLPSGDGLRGGEGKVSIEVLEGTEARVFGVDEGKKAKGREGERGEAHGPNMSLRS